MALLCCGVAESAAEPLSPSGGASYREPGIGLLTAASYNSALQDSAQAAPAITPSGSATATPPRDYNIKLGNLEGRFSASARAGYDSNVTLTDSNPESDFFAGPELGVAFTWPISDQQRLRLDLTAGYDWYFENPELDTFYIRSGSALELEFIYERIRFNLHNRFSLVDDPTVRPEISGSGAELVEYRMFNNTAGLSAEGQPYEDLTLYGGYDFGIDRSLSDQFETQDLNEHQFNLGGYYAVSAAWALGLDANLRAFNYLDAVQNDGLIYTVGPTITYAPSEFLRFTGNVGYTASSYDDTGSLTDSSEFSGMTFGFSAAQQISQRMNHSLAFDRSIDPGFNSNYTDRFNANYSWTGRASDRLTLTASPGYTYFEQSGAGGETANLYSFRASAQYAITARWSGALSYNYFFKDSDQSNNDYDRHEVVLSVTRRL